MRFFSPPKSAYTNYYDQSKFNLLWQVGVVLITLMVLVSISYFFYPHHSPIPYLIAIFIIAIALFVLNQTKKYETISKCISICFAIIITAAFFLMPRIIHYITPMWMMMNIIFTFLILGQIWGFTILAAHFVVVLIYFNFQLEHNLQNLAPYSSKQALNFSAEYIICGTGIAYFLYQFIKANKHAENAFKKANEDLIRTNTELDNRNRLITTQNEEKEIMLREIHHRVKNNLQVISSLLSLQSRNLDNCELSVEFAGAVNRVQAMALVHEEMYKNDMLVNFDTKSYLNSLALHLMAEQMPERKVELTINSTLKKVSSKTIVPIALIFNELISSSIKSKIDPLVINVDIYPTEDNYFQLDYQDNGNWEYVPVESFGEELIDAMTQQLGGTKQVDYSNEGIQYVFSLQNINEDFLL